MVVLQPNKINVDANGSTGSLVSWDFGDGTQGSGVTTSHTFTQGGTYTVTCVVVDTVCNTVDSATYTVSMTIGIDESLLYQSLNVYPNPNDGRGVIITLTEFGREKREYSKEKVLTFNEAIKNNIPLDKLEHFYEVAELINDLVTNKKIYNQNESRLKYNE